MTVTASDNANLMKCMLPLYECDGAGAFCLPNRLILDAMKDLPEQPLSFEIDDTNILRVRYQGGSFKLTAQSADEYPRMQALREDIQRRR